MTKGIFIIFSVFFLFLGVAEAADDLFTVRGVQVDVTAASASAARDQAMSEAQNRALAQLLASLSADPNNLPNVDKKNIGSYVKGMEVEQEKSSTVRYIGSFAVSFYPDAIRQLLRDNGMRFSEVKSRPVLLLPVLEYQGGKLLWEENNLWKQALANPLIAAGLVPIIIPLGDMNDLQQAPAEQVMAFDPQSLDALAQKYDAGETYIAETSLRQNEQGIFRAETILRKSNGETLGVAPANGISPQDTLNKAAQAVKAALEESWKRLTARAGDYPQTIEVVFPVESLPDWVAVRQRLKQINILRQITIRAMSHDKMQMIWQIIGDQAQVEAALRQQQLSLLNRGGYYLLRQDRGGFFD
ncbi:MAG: DUF2066 domain-containing protein [Dongiaceae bacterium]